MALQTIFNNFFRPRPSYPRQNTHLMLAGINQKIFLNQWGEPDLKISLDRLQGFYSSRQIILKNEVSPEDHYTVWIYENKDRIFFFKRGSLISHLKWSQFKSRLKRPFFENHPKAYHPLRPFFTSTIALVA
jgi:hypothetical protein